MGPLLHKNIRRATDLLGLLLVLLALLFAL